MNQLSPVSPVSPLLAQGRALRRDGDISAEEVPDKPDTPRATPVQATPAIEEVLSGEQRRPGKGPDPFSRVPRIEPGPRLMPGPRVLEAMIQSMGGAGHQYGPGQLVNDRV